MKEKSPQVVEKEWGDAQRAMLTLERSGNRLVVAGGKGKYNIIDAYK